MRLLPVIAILLCEPGLAAQGIKMDGNWWRSLSTENRLYFAWGLGDGLILGRTLAGYSAIHHLKDDEDKEAAADKVLQDYTDALKLFSKTTTGGVSERIDAFYEDARNRPIELDNAMIYILMKMRGRSERELDEWLQGTRKDAVKH